MEMPASRVSPLPGPKRLQLAYGRLSCAALLPLATKGWELGFGGQVLGGDACVTSQPMRPSEGVLGARGALFEKWRGGNRVPGGGGGEELPPLCGQHYDTQPQNAGQSDGVTGANGAMSPGGRQRLQRNPGAAWHPTWPVAWSDGRKPYAPDWNQATYFNARLPPASQDPITPGLCVDESLGVRAATVAPRVGWWVDGWLGRPWRE